MQRVASGEQPARSASRSRRGPVKPEPPSFKGLLVRAAIIAAIYFAFLVMILDESLETAGVVAVFGFALMIPLGMLLDRLRYRIQLRRWEQVYAPAARRAEAEGSDPV
jgi:hypothetical protein